MTVPSVFPSGSRRVALAVAGAAVLTRVLFQIAVFEDRTYFNDERNYLAEAERVAAGEVWGTQARYPPGPVYFMAAGLAAGLDLRGLRVAQAVLGGVAAGLVVVLGTMLFGPATGALAGAATALYPYLNYVSGVLYVQNQVIPLLLFLLLALYRRQEGGGAGWVGGAGAALGVAGNFMPPMFLVAPAVAIWHGLRVRPLRRGAMDVVLLTAVTVATLVPVTIRNYRHEHRFIFVSSHGAGSLYWANNPDVDPLSRDADRWVKRNVEDRKREQAEEGWSNAQMDSALVARALAFMRDEPGRFLRNYFLRLAVMWSPVPRPWTENAHTGGGEYLIAAASSAPAILLGLAGMIAFARDWRRLFPIFAIPLLLTAVFSLFHTTVRYRLTFEPLLLLLGAAIVVRWLARARGRRSA